MENLVKYIIENLCSQKDAISIETLDRDDNSVVIKVKVAEEDKGKVIGRNGKIAQAIRAIVKSASSKTGKRYFVDID